MSHAHRASWKARPPPQTREPLSFEASFDEPEFQLLSAGVVPKAMEDKWFIYLEEGWLHFHRSWTGAEIYAVQLARSEERWCVTDSWVNRDPDQYRGSDLAYDRELLRFIIDAFLLRKPATFPMPKGVTDKPVGVVQHHLVGRAYPQKPPKDA